MKKLLIALTLLATATALWFFQMTRQPLASAPADKLETAWPEPSAAIDAAFQAAASTDRLLSPGAEPVFAQKVIFTGAAVADDAASDPAGHTARAAFAHLAPGEPKVVDFVFDESTRSRLTRREQADQLRDWLLFTVVWDAGLSPDELNRALFDVPQLRHAYLRPLANFEYGLTRACHIGDGKVIALTPKCDDAQRKDYLAHIADEYRKNLGQKPRQFVVFSYELDVDKLLGRLNREADIPGDELFTSKYGYYEAAVNDRGACQKLMDAIEDVTHARIERGAEAKRLVLGGRRLQSRTYRGLRLEDVAAVWQAQSTLYNRFHAEEVEFAREQTQLKDKWQSKLDDLNRRYQAQMNPDAESLADRAARLLSEHPPEFVFFDQSGERKAPPPEDKVPTPSSEAEYRAACGHLQKRYEAEAEALFQAQGKRLGEKGLFEHTGFSLDPAYDYQGLLAWFDNNALKPLLQVAGSTKAPVAANDVRQAREELSRRNEVPLLVLLDKLQHADDQAAQTAGAFFWTEMRNFQFQAARYDGDLQGTEIGMVLFYTDLLAKLWVSVDYGAPKRAIEDFRTGPDGGLAPIYKQETMEEPSTRLWFGPEDSAYQLVDDRNGLLFARRATRLFAASSNPLLPGVEVPASYQAERRMGWWNDHYEEVADYEPEYQRLNEYIKWSVLLSWLLANDEGPLADFLGDVGVDHSAWFPAWCKAHRQPERALKFDQWQKVAFCAKGYKGTSTEAMPILTSRAFSNFGEKEATWTISGGVSGASPRELKSRAVLPQALAPTAKLSLKGVDWQSLNGDARSFATYRGTKHSFDSVGGKSLMRVEPKAEQPLRSADTQLARASFERKIGGSPRQVEFSTTVQTEAGSAELGTLRIEPAANGFRVGCHSREIDRAHSLVRDLSASRGDALAVLIGDPRVETLVSLGPETFLVKLRGTAERTWLKISAETEASASVPDGFDARVAGSGVGAKSYDLAWTDAATVARDYPASKYVRIEAVGRSDKRPHTPFMARGPPLAELMASGRKVDAADLLANNYEEGYRALAADREGRLDDIDALLKAGRKNEAIGLLDDALEVYPKDADFFFRRGLADIARGRAEMAPDLNRVAGWQRQGQKADFVGDVSRLFGGHPPKAQRAYAATTSKTKRLRDIQARKQTTARGEQVVVDGEHRLKVSFDDPLKLRRAKLDEVGPDARLYVDDRLDFSNLEWSLGTGDRTVHQSMPLGAEIYGVDDPNPAFSVKPDFVVAPEGQSRTTYRFAAPPRTANPTSNVGDDDDEEEDEDEDDDAGQGKRRSSSATGGRRALKRSAAPVFVIKTKHAAGS